MTRRISAVIPVRNDAVDLPAAVHSVCQQPGVVEVLLCVGPSSDDTVDVAESLAARQATVSVVYNPDGGIPQALNLGLAAVTGDVLLRLDAHSVLPPSYAATALETLIDVGASNVGAVQWTRGHTLVERAIAAAMQSAIGSGAASYRRGRGGPRPVDTAFLGFFDVAALRAVGGWDESFARNEDAELNHRLNTAGHQVWLDPRLVVEYRPRGSLRALANQYWQYGWWRRRTVSKHPESLKLRQLAAPTIVMALVVAVLIGALVTPWAFAVVGAYGVAVLIAGLATEGPFHQRLLTSAALVTMHLAWGAGFLASRP